MRELSFHPPFFLPLLSYSPLIPLLFLSPSSLLPLFPPSPPQVGSAPVCLRSDCAVGTEAYFSALCEEYGDVYVLNLLRKEKSDYTLAEV